MKEQEKDKTEHLSWFSRLMGGKLSAGEILYLIWLFISIFVAFYLALGMGYVGANGLSPIGEVVSCISAYTAFFYPVYIIPLVIIASRLSKRLKRRSLFYFIPAIPAIICLISIVILFSSWAEPKPEGYDSATYENLGIDIGGKYARDKNHVYYHLAPLKGADPASFRVIGNYSGYSVDKNHVYYLGEIVENANPMTFKLTPEKNGCDCNDYYHGKIAFHVTDYPSFQEKSRTWFIDNNKVYYIDVIYDEIQQMDIKDYHSFEVLDCDYAKDSCQVYFQGTVIEGADPASFVICDALRDIGQDKNWVYYKDKATDVKDFRHVKLSDVAHGFYQKGCDIYTMELLKMPEGIYLQHLRRFNDYGEDWSDDCKRVYWKNKVVSGVNVKTFTPCRKIVLNEFECAHYYGYSSDYGTDGKHVFYRDTLLEGADPSSFVCGVDGEEHVEFACDKNRFYLGRSTNFIKRLLSGKVVVNEL